jgi:hypothetical protein
MRGGTIMQAQWIDLLKQVRNKLTTSGYQLQEVANYSDTNYNEEIMRLSEHCDKMVKTINALLKEEKANV